MFLSDEFSTSLFNFSIIYFLFWFSNLYETCNSLALSFHAIKHPLNLDSWMLYNFSKAFFFTKSYFWLDKSWDKLALTISLKEWKEDETSFVLSSNFYFRAVWFQFPKIEWTLPIFSLKNFSNALFFLKFPWYLFDLKLSKIRFLSFLSSSSTRWIIAFIFFSFLTLIRSGRFFMISIALWKLFFRFWMKFLFNMFLTKTLFLILLINSCIFSFSFFYANYERFNKFLFFLYSNAFIYAVFSFSFWR